MASPQCENGHIDIANEIAEQLARLQLNGYESRILWIVWRKTYGWHKKEDRIPVSQFVEATGIHKSHVSRTLKGLLQRKIVTENGNFISFNKDYTLWDSNKFVYQNKKLPNSVTVKVTENGNKKLPNSADSKEKKEIKKITKKKSVKYLTRESVDEELVGRVAGDYSVSPKDVRFTLVQMESYALEKPGKVKDWNLTLRKWVTMGIQRGSIKEVKVSGGWVESPFK